MNSKARGRRRFLKEGAALAGLAAGAGRPASAQTPGTETPETLPKYSRAYGSRSRFEKTVRMDEAPMLFGRSHGTLTPLQDSVGVQVYRRLVTRWEYHIENFFGMVRLGCMKIMPRYF